MMEMFDFNSIETNKQGKKSEKQVKLIKEAANPGIWLYGGLGVLLLGGCSYAAMAGMGGGSALSFLGILLAAVGLFASLRGFTVWNLRRKLLSEPVQAAEGTVTYKMQNALTQLIEADHFVAETDGGKKLHPIGLAGINPKLPLGAYRFYYLNTRGWLLEAEPLFNEAEMRNGLNDFLAAAFGYDQAYLENCRQEARQGKLKTVEGLPQLDVHGTSAIGPEEIAYTHYYCKVGEVKFEITDRGRAAIFETIPHRAYYREGKEGKLAAIEIA